MTQSDSTPSATASIGQLTPTSSNSLKQYYREKIENVRRNLPEAARQLKAIGVDHVSIQYDGCGDSGQIEAIAYFDESEKPVDPTGRIAMTEDALMDLFYDLTQARHPGWENNDGAFGELEWDLKTDSLSHTHNDRFTDYSTTKHEGL